MDGVVIFHPTDDFLSSLKSLNMEDEKECVEDFKSIAIRTSKQDDCPSRQSLARQKILGTILDRVAFFPLKPAVMQDELVRHGLNESLAQGLASAWAEMAKKVVLARRMIKGDLLGVEFETLCNVSSGEESINVQLNISDNKKVLLTFKPEELFAFYEHLEEIQNNIDKICK